MNPAVCVVRTGTANLASVLAGLERAGAEPHLSQDPRELERARHVVLPGVGSFAAAMENLRAAALVDALAERIAAARPTLTICLGLQLLGEASEESPGVRGLGSLPLRSRRFEGELRVPHLGWNEVVPDDGCALLRRGHAYFAHSYHVGVADHGRVDGVADDWHVARTDYGVPFVAAVERGPVLACQFHPELSGAFGHELLVRWLERGNAAC